MTNSNTGYILLCKKNGDVEKTIFSKDKSKLHSLYELFNKNNMNEAEEFILDTINNKLSKEKTIYTIYDNYMSFSGILVSEYIFVLISEIDFDSKEENTILLNNEEIELIKKFLQETINSQNFSYSQSNDLLNKISLLNNDLINTQRELIKNNIELKKSKEEVNKLLKSEKKLLKKAEKANNMKSLFVSKVTHDLKTPIISILGFANLMKPSAKDEDFIEHLDLIIYSAENMLNLINGLLDISKIENNSLTLQQTKFDLYKEISDLIDSIKNIFERKSNKVIFEQNEKVPKIIFADKYRLNRIIQNLLSNSNKFTSNGTIILKVNLVSEEKEHYFLEFTLFDTGKGIDNKKLKNIFKPYYQAHEFDNSGTGLGLSLCKELVELMEGEISITSTLNKGTKVRFTIKVCKK